VECPGAAAALSAAWSACALLEHEPQLFGTQARPRGSAGHVLVQAERSRGKQPALRDRNSDGRAARKTRTRALAHSA